MSDLPSRPDAGDDLPVFTPVEQLPITMLETVILAVRRDDGTIFLAIRDLCATVQLVLSSQLRCIRGNPLLREGLAHCHVETAGFWRNPIRSRER